MAKYSKSSSDKLSTCHIDLQVIFNEVIKYFDNTVIYGNRPKDLQLDLFMKGRAAKDGKWIIVNKKEVVTYVDGYNIVGKHNLSPSEAVDSAPYPIDFNDVNRIRVFAGFVLGVAAILKAQGKITHDLKWGGDWDRDTDLNDQNFNDLLHFELV